MATPTRWVTVPPLNCWVKLYLYLITILFLHWQADILFLSKVILATLYDQAVILTLSVLALLSQTHPGAITHTVRLAARSQLKVGSDSEHTVDISLHCQTFKTSIQTQSQLALVTQWNIILPPSAPHFPAGVLRTMSFSCQKQDDC